MNALNIPVVIDDGDDRETARLRDDVGRVTDGTMALRLEFPATTGDLAPVWLELTPDDARTLSAWLQAAVK